MFKLWCTGGLNKLHICDHWPGECLCKCIHCLYRNLYGSAPQHSYYLQISSGAINYECRSRVPDVTKWHFFHSRDMPTSSQSCYGPVMLVLDWIRNCSHSKLVIKMVIIMKATLCSDASYYYCIFKKGLVLHMLTRLTIVQTKATGRYMYVSHLFTGFEGSSHTPSSCLLRRP